MRGVAQAVFLASVSELRSQLWRGMVTGPNVFGAVSPVCLEAHHLCWLTLCSWQPYKAGTLSPHWADAARRPRDLKALAWEYTATHSQMLSSEIKYRPLNHHSGLPLSCLPVRRTSGDLQRAAAASEDSVSAGLHPTATTTSSQLEKGMLKGIIKRRGRRS